MQNETDIGCKYFISLPDWISNSLSNPGCARFCNRSTTVSFFV